MRTAIGWAVIVLFSAVITGLAAALPHGHASRFRTLRLTGIFVMLLVASYFVAR